MCDDIEATRAELAAKGATFGAPVTDEGYGLVTMVDVPGADPIQLYQPRHTTAYGPPTGAEDDPRLAHWRRGLPTTPTRTATTSPCCARTSWRTVENSAGYLLAHLAPGLDVLDVGCGPGTITADLARRVAPGAVVGIDRSDDVIDRARPAAAGASTTCASRWATCTRSPTPTPASTSCTPTRCSSTCPIRWRRCGTCGGCAGPGGVVAARDADYASFAWAPLDARLDRWLAMYRAVARGNRAEPDAGRHLLGWAHAAGFTVGRGRGVGVVLLDPRGPGVVGRPVGRPHARSSVGDQAVEAGQCTRGDLDAMADAFTGWAAHPDAWFAVLHGEIVARP